METSRLRIAMLAAHSCPVGELGAKDTGGMSVYIREVARELARLGHTVDVYTRIHDPHDRISEPLGEGARLIHVRAGQAARLNKLEIYGYLPQFARHLERYRTANGLEYDLIFSHYWLSGLVGQWLQKWWRAPQAIMFHTLGAVKKAVGMGKDDPVLRLAAEKELSDDCQCIVASTLRSKEEHVRYCGASPEKISVVPCGVNMTLFQPVNRENARRKLGLEDGKVMLFVGRLDPLKGVARLLEAIPLLGDFPHLKLVIIGGDDSSRAEIEKVKKLSAELNINDIVDLRGTVKQEELSSFYSAADVCVVPSYYESFGLVALEALACGAPVVATNVGDLQNIIRPGRTGYVVGDNAPAALAEGIARVLALPPRDSDTVFAIRASVARYTWSGVAAALARELAQVRLNWLNAVV